jgi:asparagine N-glycosylation enzyme membrane subunit Stt3
MGGGKILNILLNYFGILFVAGTVCLGGPFLCCVNKKKKDRSGSILLLLVYSVCALCVIISRLRFTT